jgi:hypothetical protein
LIKRRLSSVLFLGLMGVGLALLTSGGSPRAVAQDKPANQPFTFNGHTFESKADFLEHGFCATRQPTAKEAAQINAHLQNVHEPLRAPGFKFIKVHVHVITTDEGEGDVSDETINDQIAFLNRAFAGEDQPAPGQRPSGQPTADTPFRFVLASIDRTANTEWHYMLPGSDAEIKGKTALRRGTAKDLNIYVCEIGFGILGYATFPSWYASAPHTDGIVVDLAGFLDGWLDSHNDGDVTVHEVGHWMGLYHTFQDGCSGSISAGGDGIGDTPAEAEPFFGAAPPYRDSCRQRGRDPIENFMDYSDNAYMFQFTNGQVSRMNKMVLQYRGL